MTALAEVVATSDGVAATSSRLAKIAALAALLRRLVPEEIEIAVPYLSGDIRQGKLGIGYASLAAARSAGTDAGPALELGAVDAAFTALAKTKGKGAAAERTRKLRELFARATPGEQNFLIRLVIGELRQGALEGVMLDAIAQAAAVPAADVRRAAMYSGGLPAVAKAALTEGPGGLARFSIRLLQPVQPMLAQPAADIHDTLTQLGRAAFEWKLDGARVQVHKAGDAIRVFTRSRNDVTAAVPEIVEAVSPLPSAELILDGEVIALTHTGAPQPFQVTMRRFGRKLDVAAIRRELPLSAFFFDCLRHNGGDLAHHPARERFEALSSALPPALLVPRLITDDPTAAAAFYEDAIRRGHEGVVAKSLDGPYEAGRRGSTWLKLKRAKTLDLVVLAAEWGNGRRRGWLSNLHLGARDAATGAFVMLGKTFKGLTDKMLKWQTEAFLAREVGRDAYTVHVKPEIVVEIAFNDLQASPHYPGGLALRFARVKRYRPDKRAEEVDTMDAVRAIYAAQSGQEAAGMGLEG